MFSDTYRRTRVAKCTRGRSTIDRSDSWWKRKGQGSINNDHLKKNAGRTSEGYHLEVVTGHELDVHHLPQSRRVWSPCDLASASCIEDLSRTRSRRRRIGQGNQRQGQNES